MHSDTSVLIVGGAAMGSSVAYHLLSDRTFQGRVVVVEKDPTYGRSASALSATAAATLRVTCMARATCGTSISKAFR